MSGWKLAICPCATSAALKSGTEACHGGAVQSLHKGKKGKKGNSIYASCMQAVCKLYASCMQAVLQV